MDDLADSLATSFQVTSHPNNPAAPHPRFSDYKKRPGFTDQRVRRQRLLERQKRNRFDYLNLTRRLAEDQWEDAKENDKEKNEEDMDTEVPWKPPGRYYRNQLMLSEWLVEKPEDFEESWVMVPCPVGRRSLIIASKGVTTVYSKSGIQVNRFQSCLPGGSTASRSDHTILDGIFVELERTYYILDIMCWRGHPIYDSETEFRLYWLKAKFDETPEVCTVGGQNKYKMIGLPNFACTKENLTNVMATPMNTELDGLLFYHKKTHYMFGPTPLVLWLKPYMLPEILGVIVPDFFLEQKPSDYVCFSVHVDRVTADKERSEKQQHLANRGRFSGRRGRGRGQGRSINDAQSTEGTSKGNDGLYTSNYHVLTPPRGSGYYRGYRGRGRGRGRRGQGRSPQGGDMCEMSEQNEAMEVSLSGRRGRRKQKQRCRASDTMEVVDITTAEGPNETSP